MNPYILNLTGKPDSGKTTFAMFLLEHISNDSFIKGDASITHIAVEPMAARLCGIPKEWTEGKVRTVLPGYKDGKRKTGRAYYDTLLTSAREPTNTPINIIDTMTGIALNRQADTIESQGGLPSDTYKEYGAAQTLCKNYFTTFCEANRASCNIFLHHAKTVSTYPAREVVDHLPELVGQKLDDVWPGQFEANFWLVKDEVSNRNPNTKKMEQSERHLIHIARPRLASFVFMRRRLGTPKPQSPLDITVKGGDFTPLRKAWDVILGILE